MCAVSSAPPGLSVGHEEFVTLLDGLAPAPYAHPQLTALGPPLLEERVWFRLNAAEVIYEPSLVPSVLCVHGDANPVSSAVKREIVVRIGSVVAMDLANVIEDKRAWGYLFGGKKSRLAMSGMRWVRNQLDCGWRPLNMWGWLGAFLRARAYNRTNVFGDGRVVSGLRKIG